MHDKMISDSRVYTDVQSLENLRYESKKNPSAVKQEMAKQFESLLLQMMLRSMRDANKAFKSDLMNAEQMDFYQEMYDQQLTLALSSTGMGIATAIERNIDQNDPSAHANSRLDLTPSSYGVGYIPTANVNVRHSMDKASSDIPPIKAIPAEEAFSESEKSTTFSTQEEFVKNLWPAAKVAANKIGAQPEVLLAQAALETNWGKNIIPHGKNESTHNVFNIKADSSWSNKSTLRDSLEQRNGVLVKEKSSFRSYDSFMESFLDYADFLKQNPRYTEALDKAPDPHKFVHALQKAGYATDTNYADKILKIFSSPTFKGLVEKMQ